MGGIGSGNRWRHGARSSTDDLHGLDIRRLAAKGALRPGFVGSWQWLRRDKVVASIGLRTESDRLILTYQHSSQGGDWEDERYSVGLSWTRCHLGGHRPWFMCPASGCGRRVAVLYGGRIFACRYCHRLAYASTRESPGDRAARKADRIRLRLGWEPGFLNGDGWKPKWMRWRTFARLKQEHDQLVGRSCAEIAHKLRLIGEEPPSQKIE
ncbi:hypothetical protein [uncultured Reyranella sp.]|uniref:hypothetical protein n=1 Tax=uncultured Reyranella sp. TaxID=735512 RepID=UPI0025FCA96C|nr:hypothetical protein [uncultured Reyranella sp.]